jgi:hypothetical protein
MVDQHYLSTGKMMMDASVEIERLREQVFQLRLERGRICKTDA